MLSFILGAVLGLLGGFVGGIFYYAKRIHQKIENKEVERQIINSLISGEEPKGEFVEVNRVAEYIKTHDGEIALGDVLEDE